MRRSLLLLSLATGCARELELPAAPAAADEPIFLGTLSGHYSLQVAAADDGESGELPIPGIESIIDLRPPDPSTPAPVVGFGDATAFDGPFFGTFDGEVIDATAGSSTFRIVRGVGGGVLAFDAALQICPSSEPLQLRARRLCSFDPSIAGIYEGVETDCAGHDARLVRLALAIHEEGLLGMFWPDTHRLFYAEGFDPLDPEGLGGTLDVVAVAAGQDDGEAFEPAPFALREADGALVFTMERQVRDPRSHEVSCVSRVRATRPTGGEPSTCRPREAAGQPFGVDFQESVAPGVGRVLWLSLYDESVETVLTPEQATCVEIEARPPGGDALERLFDPSLAPPDTSAGFLLPALGPGEQAELEIVAVWGCDARRRPIRPACLSIDAQGFTQL